MELAFPPYNIDSYNREVHLPKYMESMNSFISTFFFVLQLVGLIPPVVSKPGENVSSYFICPCGGNNHVKPLYEWFPYDRYHDVKLNHSNSKCSGKKGEIFKSKTFFMNHLKRKEDIEHKLLYCYMVNLEILADPYIKNH